MALSLPPSGEAGEDRYAPLAEINVTPMVDVMLVLLVIFMITAPLLTVGVPLDLPKSRATTLTAPKQPIIISLNHEGEVFIGDERIAADDRSTSRSPPRIRAGSSMSAPDQHLCAADDTLGLVSHAGFSKVSRSPRQPV
jgi:biopolymer transport protein TolR